MIPIVVHPLTYKAMKKSKVWGYIQGMPVYVDDIKYITAKDTAFPAATPKTAKSHGGGSQPHKQPTILASFLARQKGHEKASTPTTTQEPCDPPPSP